MNIRPTARSSQCMPRCTATTRRASQAPNYPAMKASPNDVTIGGGSVRPYAGLIDEVALWPRALSAKEINAVYDSTVTGRKK